MFEPRFDLKSRMRRLRRTESLRRLVREHRVGVDDLVLPLFVTTLKNRRTEVKSMPGVFQLSIDKLAAEARQVRDLGIPGVILFGLPPAAEKDDEGRVAWQDDGVVQRAVATIKKAAPELCVITDLCFCEYTDHGHCGPLDGQGQVDNDATLANLATQATSHARAGADMIAPSGMMDGMIAAIRTALDDAGFDHLPVMSYAAKYASGFYGPFRDAAGSTPAFGDRRGYQMDPANSDEAIREVGLDIEEGADIVMVKPAGPCLDIIRRVKDEFRMPTAAYQVSGEYAMIKAAAKLGWLDHDRVMMESLLGIKRAGADIIITYFAKDVAALLARSRAAGRS